MLLSGSYKKTKNSACISALSFFFLLVSSFSCKTPEKATAGITSPPMTVMNMSLEQDGEESSWKVTFKQSQRFYFFPSSGPADQLRLLEESQKNNTSVIITRSEDASRIITSVKKAN
jgi:hypothetical protein